MLHELCESLPSFSSLPWGDISANPSPNSLPASSRWVVKRGEKTESVKQASRILGSSFGDEAWVDEDAIDDGEEEEVFDCSVSDSSELDRKFPDSPVTQVHRTLFLPHN